MRIFPLILVAAIGCDSEPTELEHNRSVWARTGAQDYQITVERSCFCPDVSPIRVTVEGGDVVEAVRLVPDDPQTLAPSDYEDWFTIEGLFDVAEEALDDADEVTVDFDVDHGFPTAIEIDWMAEAIDDEASYYASDLRIAGEAPQPQPSER